MEPLMFEFMDLAGKITDYDQTRRLKTCSIKIPYFDLKDN